jgi:2'-5' RNA ligase
VRLFFAIWPGVEAAAVLGRLAADVVVVAGGKPVPQAKIHLTLAFLGEVSDIAGAEEAAASCVQVPPFSMRLDCVGSFRRARVAWAGSLEPIEPLAQLQSSLGQALRARGFALEERPFAAHVTLARKTERTLPRAAIPAIEWKATELQLVRSQPGTGEYSPLESWRLRGKG